MQRPSTGSGRRLILHIGLPKSGSSAIQCYLSDHATRLAECGLGWLPGSRGPNATEWAVAFSHRTNVITAEYGVRTGHDRQRLRERIADRLVGAEDRDLIISSEHLSGLIRTPAETDDLATFLQGLGFQPMIIAVIRRADYWLPSAYAEAVRSGRTIRLGPHFVDRRAHLLDHQALLARWASAFDQIRLVPYLETDKTDPAAVPRRLLYACGVPMATTADWPQPERLSRPGLSATAVEVLRRISPALELAEWTSGADRERLVELLAARHPGAGVRLTPSAARALASRGWIQTGIDTSPAAYGSGWQEWHDTEAAPVENAPQPSNATIGHTLLAVRDAGLGRQRIARRLARPVNRLRNRLLS